MRHVDITLERSDGMSRMDEASALHNACDQAKVAFPDAVIRVRFVPEDSGHLDQWDIVFNPPQEPLRIEDLR